MSTQRWAFVLATSATFTALCLSLLSAWQRGGSLAERLVWVAIGLVLVTSAHLLPALLRDAPFPVRATGNVLWATCLATACFGHAVFFVTAQQHAGEQRASRVPVTSLPSTGRGLKTILAERASVSAQLGAANARYCASTCTTLEARRVTLAARLDALNAEADEVRREQAERDRVAAQRDTLLVDPVTLRLSALLGTTTARVDLLSGLMFAAVLEGVACLLWTLALRPPLLMAEPAATGPTPAVLPAVTKPDDVTALAVAKVTNATHAIAAVVTPGTTNHEPLTVSRETDATRDDDTPGSRTLRDDLVIPIPAVDSVDDDLTRLARDVAAGLLRPTVANIRRHLGCSQSRAAILRRQLVQLTQ